MTPPCHDRSVQTPIDSQATRAVIASLCDLWDSEPPHTLEFRAELGYERAITIHTHAHHTVRMARVLLALDEMTSGIEVMPTARALLESAVTAAWILLTEGSEKSLLKEGARQRRTSLDELIALGEQPGEAHAQALSTLEKLEEWRATFNFPERCKALAGGNALYLTYRMMSAESHAGVGVADFYLSSHGPSPVGFAFNPDAVLTVRDAILGVSASMLLLAVNADDQARVKPQRTTQIATAAQLLGVGVEIQRAERTGRSHRSTNG